MLWVVVFVFSGTARERARGGWDEFLLIAVQINLCNTHTSKYCYFCPPTIWRRCRSDVNRISFYKAVVLRIIENSIAVIPPRSEHVSRAFANSNDSSRHKAGRTGGEGRLQFLRSVCTPNGVTTGTRQALCSRAPRRRHLIQL